MADELFKEILEELKKINCAFPDLRFGSVVQTAMDYDKKTFNDNLIDRSSKQILTALQNFHAYHEKVRGKNGFKKVG
jgi:hypothetical protein